MCGFYFSNKESEPNFKLKLDRINHRGPDYTGTHFEDKMCFGHKRLSIIDLDSRSHQPFIEHNSVMLFNGEIYNFKEIRSDLEKNGFQFKTTSDTEVLLYAYHFYGKNVVNKLNGMFAFVIYDKKNNSLFGARDRTGQKPLFYRKQDDIIELSSELTPLVNNNFEIDNDALGEYLLFGTLSSSISLIKGVHKVKPGHFFEYSFTNNEFIFEEYWRNNNKKEEHNNKTKEEYLKEFEVLLNDATKKRLLSADVKTGIFLSGGIDSTLITKYGVQNKTNTDTLSVVFEEGKFNESKYSTIVAEKFKTKHKTIVCSLKEVKDFINNIGEYLDEPMADSSILAQLLISKIARNNGYKVVLTGDGADEYFYGYKRYLWMKKILLFKKLKLNKIISKKLLPKKYARYFDIMSLEGNQMYDFLMSGLDLKNFNRITKQIKFYKSSPNKINHWDCADIDKENYLVNDINIKVDRATMAFSIEARSPFLDYRILEFANKLPNKFKMEGKEQKHLLKELIRHDFDNSFIDRKKQGFGVPLGRWLQDDFYTDLENTIENNFRLISNYFDKLYLQNLLKELKQGNFNNHHILWRIFILLKWYERMKKV